MKFDSDQAFMADDNGPEDKELNSRPVNICFLLPFAEWIKNNNTFISSSERKVY